MNKTINNRTASFGKLFSFLSSIDVSLLCPERTLSRRLAFCFNAEEYGNMRSGIICATVQTYCKCVNHNPRTSKSVSWRDVKIGVAIVCRCTCMTRMENFCLRKVSIIGDSIVRLFHHNSISFKTSNVLIKSHYNAGSRTRSRQQFDKIQGYQISLWPCLHYRWIIRPKRIIYLIKRINQTHKIGRISRRNNHPLVFK